MKGEKFCLIAAAAVLGTFSAANASEFTEAFKNGTLSGDVTVTMESRSVDDELNAYYADTAYAVGSTELIYKTGAFKNFSVSIGLRGYHVLWEDDDDSPSGWGQGTGDASSRFWNIDGTDIAAFTNTYLAYDTDKIHVKAGRQELQTEWLDEHHDAITVYANPTEKMEVELIWSREHYRIWARELFYQDTVNYGSSVWAGKINSEGGGVYKAGLTYQILDSVKVKGYGMTAPDNYDVYGGRINLDTKVNDFDLGGWFHAMATNESLSGIEDGGEIHANAYVGLGGYRVTLGYLATDEDGGWASAFNGGEASDPFEEGDQTYAVDSRTPYITLSKSFGGLSLYGIFGQTEYRNVKDGEEFKKNEFCLWTSYPLTDSLQLGAILTVTNEDDDDAATTDLVQVSTTLIYSF